MQRAAETLREPLMSAYGPCGGMPALVAALKEKLAAENGLTGVRPAALLAACGAAEEDAVCSTLHTAPWLGSNNLHAWSAACSPGFLRLQCRGPVSCLLDTSFQCLHQMPHSGGQLQYDGDANCGNVS
jgi:hypothetical protein